jgi:hypothetical protein
VILECYKNGITLKGFKNNTIIHYNSFYDYFDDELVITYAILSNTMNVIYNLCSISPHSMIHFSFNNTQVKTFFVDKEEKCNISYLKTFLIC